MQELQQGANAPVSASHPTVRFRWQGAEGRGVVADASAYLLTASGKVRGDEDMIFYNQPIGGGGAIRFDPTGQGSFKLDLAALPDVIQRIAFCLTIDEAHSKSHTLALVNGADVLLSDGEASVFSFRPELTDATEAAMVLAELYRRDGRWKFRAVGQGFNGGLAPLARSYGIDVADEPVDPLPLAVSHVPSILLDEAQDTAIFTSAAGGFSELLATLDWSRSHRGQRTEKSGIDLDLCCLLELRDGRKGPLQAIGCLSGAFDMPPYVQLSGNNDAGDDVPNEELRINGQHWDAISRILIFANVYDGAPNWQIAAPSLQMTIQEHPSIEINISAGRDDRRICAIALIENDNGKMKTTRQVEFFVDQRELDQRFEWGVKWQPGTKA